MNHETKYGHENCLIAELSQAIKLKKSTFILVMLHVRYNKFYLQSRRQFFHLIVKQKLESLCQQEIHQCRKTPSTKKKGLVKGEKSTIKDYQSITYL